MQKQNFSHRALPFLRTVLNRQWRAFADLLPIVLVILFFQLVVLRQPLPQLTELLAGGLLVVVGLSLFVQGLETGLFPVGEAMAYNLAEKGKLRWLLLFAFLLGFSTTVAEPALIAVSEEAAEIAAEGALIPNSQGAMFRYAMGLRLSVALSVGFAILIGVLRIVRGWPIHYLIIGGYALVMLITIIAPDEIVGIDLRCTGEFVADECVRGVAGRGFAE